MFLMVRATISLRMKDTIIRETKVPAGHGRPGNNANSRGSASIPEKKMAQALVTAMLSYDTQIAVVDTWGRSVISPQHRFLYDENSSTFSMKEHAQLGGQNALVIIVLVVALEPIREPKSCHHGSVRQFVGSTRTSESTQE